MKKELIKKVNQLLKEIRENETKAKQLTNILQELKINTTYQNNVLLNVKPNISNKDLDILIDIITVINK